MHTETLLTIGEIARRLGQALHRIEYVIRSRNIQPTSWAGHPSSNDTRDEPCVAYYDAPIGAGASLHLPRPMVVLSRAVEVLSPVLSSRPGCAPWCHQTVRFLH
jgi:hypothetical protein